LVAQAERQSGKGIHGVNPVLGHHHRRGGAQLGWVFGFVEDYENLAMLFKLAMGG
jgi:hypothetical protein